MLQQSSCSALARDSIISSIPTKYPFSSSGEVAGRGSGNAAVAKVTVDLGTRTEKGSVVATILPSVLLLCYGSCWGSMQKCGC